MAEYRVGNATKGTPNINRRRKMIPVLGTAVQAFKTTATSCSLHVKFNYSNAPNHCLSKPSQVTFDAYVSHRDLIEIRLSSHDQHTNNLTYGSRLTQCPIAPTAPRLAARLLTPNALTAPSALARRRRYLTACEGRPSTPP